MATDWLKSTIITLIKVYKKEENLYNPKHPLYYNKIARQKSLDCLLSEVRKTRPETILLEINKKIQSLRTQFGQEVHKIEKSKALGNEFVYVPKIYWFKHFSFIGDYMKTRTDPSPLSNTIKSVAKEEQESLFDIDEAADLEEENDKYDVFNIESVVEPPEKRKRANVSTPKVVRAKVEPFEATEHHEDTSSPTRTIEYTLINENDDMSELDPLTRKQYVEYQEVHGSDLKQKRFRKRCKTFSKYVEALMHEITDENIFFETQRAITNLIHDATTKQPSFARNS